MASTSEEYRASPCGEETDVEAYQAASTASRALRAFERVVAVVFGLLLGGILGTVAALWLGLIEISC